MTGPFLPKVQNSLKKPLHILEKEKRYEPSQLRFKFLEHHLDEGKVKEGSTRERLQKLRPRGQKRKTSARTKLLGQLLKNDIPEKYFGAGVQRHPSFSGDSWATERIEKRQEETKHTEWNIDGKITIDDIQNSFHIEEIQPIQIQGWNNDDFSDTIANSKEGEDSVEKEDLRDSIFDQLPSLRKQESILEMSIRRSKKKTTTPTSPQPETKNENEVEKPTKVDVSHLLPITRSKHKLRMDAFKKYSSKYKRRLQSSVETEKDQHEIIERERRMEINRHKRKTINRLKEHQRQAEYNQMKHVNRILRSMDQNIERQRIKSRRKALHRKKHPSRTMTASLPPSSSLRSNRIQKKPRQIQTAGRRQYINVFDHDAFLGWANESREEQSFIDGARLFSTQPIFRNRI